MGCTATLVFLGFLLLLITSCRPVDGAIPSSTRKKIREINRNSSYLGIVVPNSFEMNPLLQSPSFVADENLPYLDFGGITTQLLLSLFRVEGVVHYGIAGNANPELEIGDVTIPQYWAHTGLWNWQRYGDGVNDTLPLESNGDYTRTIGFLNYSDYTVVNGNELPSANLLNSVWYQPEEIFPVNGTPEMREHAFWVPVNSHYLAIAKKIGNLTLERCVNSTCLPRNPGVFMVERGCSANVYLDNAAYREFLNTKFKVTPLDMESAAVALISLQQGIPFIAIRALSDLAGGGSAVSNEADIFASLASQNSVVVLLKFIALL